MHTRLLYEEEIKISLNNYIPNDIITYIIIPYISILDMIFDINVGNTSLYEIYKGFNYSKIEVKKDNNESDYDSYKRILLIKHYKKEELRQEDYLYERLSYSIGFPISIKPRYNVLNKSENFFVNKEYLNNIVKYNYLDNKNILLKSDFCLLDNENNIYKFDKNYYGWNLFYNIRNNQDFNNLKTKSFKLQLIYNSNKINNIVLDEKIINL